MLHLDEPLVVLVWTSTDYILFWLVHKKKKQPSIGLK